jgi:alpha-1,3-rhamnosyl/mannosyltransferase
MAAKKPLNILFDANTLMTQRTGIGYYTAGLVAALAAADPDIRLTGYYYNFLARKQPPAGPQAPNITYRPIYHLPGPVTNLLRRFSVEVPVELLALTSADFVLYPNFLGQPSLRRTPNAPVVHDLMYLDHPEWGSDKNVRDLTRFMPRVLQRASFVMTVSEFSRQRLIEAYGIDESRIITTFIPPEPVTPLPADEASELVSKQGIDKPYLLFIGTMEPRKNIANLMDAYQALPERLRKSHTLVLAGKTDWKYHETMQRMESLQAEGADIRYLGYIDDKTRAALYQRAALFVMTSHYEGFGMQTLEAFQYGTPCALSDITVFREVAGDKAAYFNHLDPSDISRVIAGCLDNPPPDAASLQSYVAGRPDWPAVAAEVLAAIRRTVR